MRTDVDANQRITSLYKTLTVPQRHIRHHCTMAELEAVADLIEGTEDGLADEIGEEAEAELQEEAKAAQANVSTLRKIVDGLKTFITSPTMEKIGLFIAKNVAIGGILYATTYVLKKIVEGGSGDKAAQQQRYKKICALAGIVKDMSEKAKVLLKWLKDHENDTVEVGDGITVLLPGIFYKFTKKMDDVSSVEEL